MLIYKVLCFLVYYSLLCILEFRKVYKCDGYIHIRNKKNKNKWR